MSSAILPVQIDYGLGDFVSHSYITENFQSVWVVDSGVGGTILLYVHRLYRKNSRLLGIAKVLAEGFNLLRVGAFRHYCLFLQRIVALCRRIAHRW